MMTSGDFLFWVRGPAFQIATAIFAFGISWHLLEILSLGRKPDRSVPRGSRMLGGLRTIFSRSIADKSIFQSSAFTIVASYIFHLGFFIVLFLLVPHIMLFQALLGFGWAGLPTTLIDVITIITLLALLALLIHRLKNPVRRFLSTFEDYLAWTVTFLALLTGYLAYHHSIQPYSLVLGLHILSVEILMVVFPFTKLMHTFTFIIARWYIGANAGHRGIQL
ncbi:MAG: hypothetical protein DRR19_19380 [Candidatus Parabeggiatoa sp. nov. 1]|nr:MAG: hypothetical protein DRR19_19380 [Gammaproteobacteria bacterium]HEC83922.1 hypothetical protein [Thioploca sp.]